MTFDSPFLAGVVETWSWCSLEGGRKTWSISFQRWHVIVHTFHIGFGADMAASLVVWLCKLKWFGGDGFVSFDERLSAAYSHFREFCHTTKRFTACDHWSPKKFSMASILGWFLLITFCSKIVLFMQWFFTAKISIYKQHLPSSLASKEQWLPYQHCWERSRYCSCLQVAWISLCWGWYLAPIPSKKP